MKVTREDLLCIDAIIKALNRLRFDLSGVECLQLAAQLSAFGTLRIRVEAEVLGAEESHAALVKRAMAELDAPKVLAPAPPALVPQEPAPAHGLRGRPKK